MLQNGNGSNSHKGPLTPEEEEAKMKGVRSALGPLSGHTLKFCSDECIYRYLRATNWSLKKAKKMLQETIKWREEYKPEEITWGDIAKEAETGKIYRANFSDKEGRTVLAMRPAAQNTTEVEGQMKYLVYCMENATLNLPPNQEQMVWLVDFKGWNMSVISVKSTRETAHILQNHYPERLAYAILYNPPKVFETFWTIVKPFLEKKTYKKVKFVYANDQESEKLMERLFDLEKLESAFGGQNSLGFNLEEYGKQMQEDDEKMAIYWNSNSEDGGISK